MDSVQRHHFDLKKKNAQVTKNKRGTSLVMMDCTCRQRAHCLVIVLLHVMRIVRRTLRENSGTGGVLTGRIAGSTHVLALILWSRLGDEKSAATSALIHCNFMSGKRRQSCDE